MQKLILNQGRYIFFWKKNFLSPPGSRAPVLKFNLAE